MQFSGGGAQISARSVFLFATDSFFILLSILIGVVIRMGLENGVDYLLHNKWPLFGTALVYLIVFFSSGLYETGEMKSKSYAFRLPFIAVLISTGIIIILFYAQFSLFLGRGVLFLISGFVYIFVALVRRVCFWGMSSGFLARNALIVGEGREAEEMVRLLDNNSSSPFKVYGIVATQNGQEAMFIKSTPVLGKIEQLKEFSQAYKIDTICIATSLTREMQLLSSLRPLRYSGIQILDYVALHEELAQEIPLDHIDDEWLMHAAMNSSRIHIRKIKRMLDVVVAVVGLIVASPLCLIAALLVKFDSPGPALYRQIRSGLDGKDYTLLKYRTMKQDAEAESGAVWATKVDNRVTRVGHFMRKWRIDEIPQLVNVLKGEMSLVGPRPERPEFVETLSGAIPFYKERLLVAPGITGWAQIKYPYTASIDSAKYKLQYDLFYIKHMSLALDVSILLRTFKTIFVGLRHQDDDQEHLDAEIAERKTVDYIKNVNTDEQSHSA